MFKSCGVTRGFFSIRRQQIYTGVNLEAWSLLQHDQMPWFVQYDLRIPVWELPRESEWTAGPNSAELLKLAVTGF